MLHHRSDEVTTDVTPIMIRHGGLPDPAVVMVCDSGVPS